MDWPILVDSLNVLGVKVVPLSYLVDEHGIIRYQNPRERELQVFLKTKYEKPAKVKGANPLDEDLQAVMNLMQGGDLSAAIRANEKRMGKLRGKELGRAQFQHGVLHRMRHDSKKREEGDFAAAIDSWEKGLASDPSQYIWRRRIQQYGPRLDKPYSFYDWVAEAQAALVKRGEKAIPLVAAISGAEIAHPLRKGRADGHAKTAAMKHPDPKGELPEDGAMVSALPVVVQGTGKNSSALRLHVALNLNHEGGAHWNNESTPPMLWLAGSEAFGGGSPALYEGPKTKLEASSLEDRSIEIELRLKKGQKMPKELTGRLFYNVCKGADGVCLFLSQSVKIPLK